MDDLSRPNRTVAWPAIALVVVMLSASLAVVAVYLGNVYVADRYNHRLRVVDDATGWTLTHAGSGKTGHAPGAKDKATFTEPIAVAVDDVGSVYMVEGSGGTHVHKITAQGDVTTLQVTPASNAEPALAVNGALGGVAVDVDGAIYVAGFYAIRKLTPVCAP